MSGFQNEVDRQARRLIRASESALRVWLGVPQLDPLLVGNLYMRQREALQQMRLANDGLVPREQLIGQLALIIYLTAAAWQVSPQPDIRLLASLRQIVASTLADAGSNAAGSDETPPRQEKEL